MFSLIGSLLGFTTSALPSVLNFFQQKSDQKHEREMAQLQIDRELALAEKGFVSQERQEAIKLEEIQTQSQADEMIALYNNDSKISDDDKAAPWVHTARAAVRPVISLGLFALFVVLELVAFVACEHWRSFEFRWLQRVYRVITCPLRRRRRGKANRDCWPPMGSV